MPIIPEGIFETERRGDKLFIYPRDSLGELGIYFVAQTQKDGKILLHDDGTILSVLSSHANPVNLVRELRTGARSLGFVFRDGRVFVKCDYPELVAAARRLERLAAEIAFKAKPEG